MIAEETDSRLFNTEHLHADLKGRSIRGGTVTIAAQGCKLIISMGSTMILARLLTPADFGLIAMVAAVTALVWRFKDMGLSSQEETLELRLDRKKGKNETGVKRWKSPEMR